MDDVELALQRCGMLCSVIHAHFFHGSRLAFRPRCRAHHRIFDQWKSARSCQSHCCTAFTLFGRFHRCTTSALPIIQTQSHFRSCARRTVALLSILTTSQVMSVCNLDMRDAQDLLKRHGAFCTSCLPPIFESYFQTTTFTMQLYIILRSSRIRPK